jgi:transposase-like protein
MNHKKEMLEMLAQAGELISDGLSPEDVIESNLLNAWLQQVSSALKAAGMKEQSAMWEEVRKVQVKINKKIGLNVYTISMRALVLGFLGGLDDDET